MKKPTALLFASLILVITACVDQPNVLETKSTTISIDSSAQVTANPNESTRILKNGKLVGFPRMKHIYEPSPLDTFDFPVITSQLAEIIDAQIQLLISNRKIGSHKIGNLTVKKTDLIQAAYDLKAFQQTKPIDLANYFDSYQIRGRDRQGNVQFTGYYTPVIPVSKKRNRFYPFPIYDRPSDWEGPFPTRREIDYEGALADLELELAYAQSRFDIYSMQLQGSGYVTYPNGKTELFAYNGTNKQPFRSVEKYLIRQDDLELKSLTFRGIKRLVSNNEQLTDTILFVDPSYTFFTRKYSRPKGAGNTELIPGASIAVDPRYIPLGSILLASVPRRGPNKKIIGHDYRILFAHDVGGAIKGPGHVDMYFGVGEGAEKEARKMNHYGRLWLLLPKKRP